MHRSVEERLTYGWLALAVSSLVFAGIFALLVALARTPFIEDLLPLGRDYIYVALVGHVDLAVVIWFLAFEGFLWTHTATGCMGGRVFSPLLGWAGLVSASAGMALVVIAALFGMGGAELANYVPILDTPVFFAGLILFGLGILVTVINTLITVLKAKGEGKTLPVVTFGMSVSAFTVLVAFICFGLSWYFQYSTGKAFLDFERLFWGGGHVLQFANTISMVTAWLYLASLILKDEPLGGRVAKWLFAFYLLFVVPAPFIYFMHDTSTQAYKEHFTALMQWGLGPSTSIFMLGVIASIVKRKGQWRDGAYSSLVLSMFVFALGGLIALDIRGVNTKIPAHYHCVIGAVTIAFMGLYYELIPAFKGPLWSRRLSAVQPYLYTLGIVLFAGGLYIAGSHGVARKTYGSEQNLNSLWKLIGMSVMGLGGLVAILGGIAFVLNGLMTMIGRGGGAAKASPSAAVETR